MNKVLFGLALLGILQASFGESTSSSKFDDKVKVYLVVSSTEKVEFDLIDFPSMIEDNRFNASNPTMIYVHGFLENADDLSVKTVAEAYLTRGGWNVIIVDWYDFATGPYVLAVLPKLKSLGYNIGRYLVYFIQAGYPYEKIHLVGHSLGGQLVGMVARTVYERSDHKYKIEDDGVFVDVIHTDAGFYGYRKPMGNIDFYPNGGSRYQPGCKRLPIIPDENQSGPMGFCSHWKSWEFFAKTVTNTSTYLATKCSSWQDFTSGRCEGGETVYMGYGTVRGTYYLNADSQNFDLE